MSMLSAMGRTSERWSSKAPIHWQSAEAQSVRGRQPQNTDIKNSCLRSLVYDKLCSIMIAYTRLYSINDERTCPDRDRRYAKNPA